MKNQSCRASNLSATVFCLTVLLFAFISQTICAAAATRVWDGGGADDNWSTAANWSGDAVPTNADDVVFNQTAVKNAIIDTAFTVGSVSINGGYTGTVTQGANANLTVSSTFTQAAGAFRGGSGTLTVNGGATISGGTFTGGTGASTFSGLNLQNGFFQQGNAPINIGPGAAGGGNYYSLSVAGGTFTGSGAELNFNNNGGLVISSGAFQGGTGTINSVFGASINQSGGTFSAQGDANAFTFTLSGGTFNAPNGLLTVVADWTHTAGGTFNAGTGTVKFTGYNTSNCANNYGIDVAATETFNNLDIANAFCNRRSVGTGDTLIVNGDLRLTAAAIQGGRLRALGTTTIDAANNGYRGTTVVEYVTPNKNFVIVNPSSIVNMLAVEMNAANSVLTNSGTGRINFSAMNVIDGTVNQGAGSWDITNPGYAQSGGTFNGSGAELFISNGAGNPIITGGTFNGGTGKVTGSFRVAGGVMSLAGDLESYTFSLEGGTFNAPLGTMSVGQSFLHTSGGTFNARTGTVQTSAVFNTYGIYFDVNQSETFNNLKFNGTSNSANHVIAAGDTFTVNGALTFAGRGVNGGAIIANGAVSYTTLGGYQNATTLVRLEGTTPRIVTFTADCASYFQPTRVDNPNLVVNTGCDDANAVLYWQSLDLRRGTVNAGNSRSIFNADFSQSGGTFNGGSNQINPATSFGGNFTLSGGDFNAAPRTFFYADYTHGAAGGAFNYGTGSVSFVGFGGVYNATIDVNGTENFNNVIFNPPNGLYTKTIAAGDTITANGNLTITGGGYVSGGTLEIKRDFSITAGFLGGSSNVLFSGAVDQTYANGSSGSPYGTWTVNKPDATAFGGTAFAPSAATTLFLSGNISNPLLNSPAAPLNIVSGNIVQTGGFDHTLASLSLATGTKFTNEYAGTLNLAGGVSNNGSLILNGGGAGCPQNDAILVRSTAAGMRRDWSGGGLFRLIDADVKDQGGTAPITVYSGTNSGNNGTNFTFDGTCLSPTAATATVEGRVTDANGRGIFRARLVISEGGGIVRYAQTNPFGFYRVADVAVGQTVIITVNHKTERFASPSAVLSVTADVTGVNFTALQK